MICDFKKYLSSFILAGSCLSLNFNCFGIGDSDEEAAAAAPARPSIVETAHTLTERQEQLNRLGVLLRDDIMPRSNSDINEGHDTKFELSHDGRHVFMARGKTLRIFETESQELVIEVPLIIPARQHVEYVETTTNPNVVLYVTSETSPYGKKYATNEKTFLINMETRDVKEIAFKDAVNTWVVSSLNLESQDIYIAHTHAVSSSYHTTLEAFDVQTGETRPVATFPANISDFTFDEKGRLKYVTSGSDLSGQTVFKVIPGDSESYKLGDSIYSIGPDECMTKRIVSVDAETGSIYYRTRAFGLDFWTPGVRTNGAFASETPMFPDFRESRLNFKSFAQVSTKMPWIFSVQEGVHTRVVAKARSAEQQKAAAFINDSIAELQRQTNSDLTPVSAALDEARQVVTFIFSSSSPTTETTYHVFSTRLQHVSQQIAAASMDDETTANDGPLYSLRVFQPAQVFDSLVTAKFRPVELVRIPFNDDDMTMEALYTEGNPNILSPQERKPLVLYAHGGPASHSKWRLNPITQYFASHGFDVLDVNFPGSSGYGFNYENKLNGRWSSISEYLLASIQWALEHKNVDPERIVTAGGSFGATAALYTLAHGNRLVKGALVLNGEYDFLQAQKDAAARESVHDVVAQTREFGHSHQSDEGVAALQKMAIEAHLAIAGYPGWVVMAAGLSDNNCLPHNTLGLHTKLAAVNADATLVTFKGRGHSLEKVSDTMMNDDQRHQANEPSFRPFEVLSAVAMEKLCTEFGLPYEPYDEALLAEAKENGVEVVFPHRTRGATAAAALTSS